MFNRITEEMEDLRGIKGTLQDRVFLLIPPEEETKRIPKWKNHMGERDYPLQKWHRESRSRKHTSALLRSSQQEERECSIQFQTSSIYHSTILDLLLHERAYWRT